MEATTGEWELLDQLRDGVVIADEDMTILYANPTLHRMTACAPGTLAGRPVDILVPADQLRAHRAGVQRVRAGGDGPRLRGPALRTRLQRADGTLADIELALRRVSGPRPSCYMALIRPVSDTVLQTDAVLASVGEGVYGLDREGRVSFVNPAAVKLTGLAEGEQLGRSQHALIHHHRADGTPYPEQDCPIVATLADGQRREVHDEVFWTASGHPLPVDYSTAPLLRDGQVTGVVVTFRDAEVRRRLERARLLEATAATQRRVISELHRAIMPDQPDLDGYRVDVTYRPAGPHAPTGGDLYDWARLPGDVVHLCVVDVAGHDVAATKEAVAAVHAIRALVLSGTPLQEVPDRASRLLQAHSPDLTATAAVVHLHLPSGRYELVSAGHPPPLHIPAGGPAWFHRPHSTPLGAPRPPATPPRTGRLEPGDGLLVYTDGLVEHDGDLGAGMERLERHFDAGPGAGAADLARVLTAGAAHPDDVLHLLIQRL